MFGEGISIEGVLIDQGIQEGLVKKAGAWFSYNEHKLGQGKENARTYLKENPEVAEEIDRLIREKYGLPIGEQADSEE